MDIVRELDETVWARFVREHPDGNIFHTPEMFEVFERTERHAPELWAVVDRSGEVLALSTPVQVALAGGPLRKVTSRSIAYGGVLAEPTPRGHVALQRLLHAYNDATKRRSLYTEVRNLSEPNGIRAPIESAGYRFEDHLNYIIDLDCSTDEILDRMSPNTRKRLRRAIRQSQVTVGHVEDRAELEQWYSVLAATYRNARVPLADRSLFEAAFDVLHPRDMIIFFVARVGHEIAACAAELRYGDTVYGWYGGTDRTVGTSTVNEVLTLKILEWGAQSGYKRYDFGGAGKPGEKYGVRDFKAKFGGDLVRPGRFVYVHSPVRLATSKLAYSVYHHRPAGLPRPAKRRVEETPA